MLSPYGKTLVILQRAREKQGLEKVGHFIISMIGEFSYLGNKFVSRLIRVQEIAREGFGSNDVLDNG